MKGRFQTDFLTSNSSFLMGVGSVLSLDGEIYDYNSSNDPDNVAIALDWEMVGQSIRDVLEKNAFDGVLAKDER